MTATIARSILLACLASALGCAHRAPPAATPTTPADRAAQSARALYKQGIAYEESGDLLRAEQYFSIALSQGGDDAEVLPALLRACIASRHLRLAAEYAEVALAKQPDNARLRFLTGALLVSIGERGRAREHLERAVQELPRDAEVQFSVAVFFRDEMTDPVSADPHFRDYLRLDPTGNHASEARGSLMERLP